MTDNFITVRLSAADRPALQSHFTRLDAEDRRLRFGTVAGDDRTHDYVEGIDFERDGVFAIHGEGDELAAVVHVACGEPSAELGLSVLREFRGRGLGNA